MDYIVELRFYLEDIYISKNYFYHFLYLFYYLKLFDIGTRSNDSNRIKEDLNPYLMEVIYEILFGFRFYFFDFFGLNFE